jgi:predicted ArsR family transcriptional regulator
LSISTEAVRQQLAFLQREGWVETNCDPEEENERAPGRPATQYCLSPRGDDLFPKRYAELTIALFDELTDPTRTLAMLTDRRVASMGKKARDANALRSIYRDGDSYMDLETSDRGYRLIEWNCPYLQFAKERPQFCSTTVSTLRRLTGCEVVREERFQDRDGRCVFHIYLDAPARRKQRFEIEPARDAIPARGRRG